MIEVPPAISARKRLLSLGALIAAVAVLAVDLWKNPEFGPPIVFGFSLSVVGPIGGSVLGLAVLASRWFWNRREPTREANPPEFRPGREV